MTTPNKEAIIEAATKAYMEDNWEISTNLPEPDELIESGHFQAAQIELMRNQGYEALNYLEEMAHQAGYSLIKNKHTSEYCHDLETYPISKIMREGCFIVGGRGTGKTSLCKTLVMKALDQKVQVKVIDSCLAWKNYPLLPRVKVRRNVKTLHKWNTIYDVSRLSILEIRDFVNDMMTKDVEEAILSTDQGIQEKCLYILEEVQNIILPNSLRTLKFQEISRMITQGRNFNLSYICSTQRLASTDTNLIEISGVRFWFKSEGENTLKKARAWLPKFAVWRLRDLETGQCYVQLGSRIKLLRLPLFEAKKVLAQ